MEVVGQHVAESRIFRPRRLSEGAPPEYQAAPQHRQAKAMNESNSRGSGRVAGAKVCLSQQGLPPNIRRATNIRIPSQARYVQY